MAQENRVPAWSFTTGDFIYSSPAVAEDGTIYIGSADNSVYAINPDGTQKWSFATGDWVDASPAIGPDGTIYIGSWDGSLYALEPANGQLKWSFPTGGLIASSAAIDGEGNVYVGSTDGFLYALDPNGNLLWQFLADEEINTSPAISPDGSILFGTDAPTLYALDVNGVERWAYSPQVAAGASARFRSSPAVDIDGTIYIGLGVTNADDSSEGAILSLDNEGGLIWSLSTADKSDSPPVIASDGTIYYASRTGFLHAIDPGGLEYWSLAVGDVFYSAPVLDAAGNVYVAAFVGNFTTRLYAIDPDGNILWISEFIDLVDSSPSIGNNGHLYVGVYDNSLHAIPVDYAPAVNGWPKFRRDLANNGNASNLSSGQDPADYFPDTVSVADGWLWCPMIGFYVGDFFPWIYTNEHGWWFCADRGIDSMWLYDLHPDIQWVWSNPANYPFLWRASDAQWLWYEPGSNPRTFWVGDPPLAIEVPVP